MEDIGVQLKLIHNLNMSEVCKIVKDFGKYFKQNSNLGNWGYCPNKCEQIRSSQTSTAKTGKCLTHKNTVCALPFKYNGKLYSTCTTEGDPDGKYWCSTKVDSNLDHVKGGGEIYRAKIKISKYSKYFSLGFWGYCSGKCGTETSTKRPTTKQPFLRPTTKKSTLGSNTKDTSNGQYQPTEADGTCGLYLGTGFIIGGVETKRGELSFLANIGYKNRRTGKITYNCGGTLINR